MTYHEVRPYSPKIVVMNINPDNIDNCIKYTISGVRINTGSVINVEKLNRGDICIIRRTTGGGRYIYGVVGIWYYYDKKDIEGDIESLWIPPDGWKYKIIMKPLVKEFKDIFCEDFSISVKGQLRHKESSKVKNLLQIDLQGAVKIGFRESDIPLKYLKVIIEEKKSECNIVADYIDKSEKILKINVHKFLINIIEELKKQKPKKVKIPELEDWKRKKEEEDFIEIDNLIKEKNKIFEKLQITLDPSEKFQLFWKLVEIFGKLKLKIKILGYWVERDYKDEYNEYLCREIFYFEKSLKMLKEKHGKEKVDLRFYLEVAQLEFEYFILKKRQVPSEFYIEDYELHGIVEDKRYNLIINNITNARTNLKLIINNVEIKDDHKDIFLFNEVMGDLYFHEYLLYKEGKLEKPEYLNTCLKCAYYFYLKSLKHKEIVERENPSTYYDGLHGLPYLTLFVGFFNKNAVSNLHDLKAKIRLLQNKILSKEDIIKITSKYGVKPLEY